MADEEEKREEHHEHPPEGKKKKTTTILLIVGGVAVVGIGLYFFSQNANGGSATPSDATGGVQSSGVPDTSMAGGAYDTSGLYSGGGYVTPSTGAYNPNDPLNQDFWPQLLTDLTSLWTTTGTSSSSSSSSGTKKPKKPKPPTKKPPTKKPPTHHKTTHKTTKAGG